MAYINGLYNHNQCVENIPSSSMFPNNNPEQEVIYEDTNPNFESARGSPETHLETWFRVPQ
jgi:hypothetical protein